jgi:hypothetical protein
MAYEDNLDEILDAIDELVDTFDFTLPGQDRSIGRDAAHSVGLGIQIRSTHEQIDANGAQFEPNERKYAEWKARSDRYDAHQPNVRTGQMLSLESLLGEVTVGKDLVEITYGKDKPAEKSMTGYMTKSDRETTDRDKAAYAHEERPFWGLDKRIANGVAEDLTDHLDDHVEYLWHD